MGLLFGAMCVGAIVRRQADALSAGDDAALARRRIRVFLKNQEGATLVEFAIVAPAFILMVASFFEVALILLASTSLSEGGRDLLRDMRLGTAVCSTRQEMVKTVCDAATFLPECATHLTLNAAATSIGYGADLDALLAGDVFQPGQSGQLVALQTTYEWQIVSPLLSPLFGDGAGGLTLRQQYAVKSEAFGAVACGS